jgi:hypothetical protein
LYNIEKESYYWTEDWVKDTWHSDTIEPKSLYIITASQAKKRGDHIEC